MSESASTGLAGSVAIVTGASRGLGRGIAVALTQAGAHVVGLGRAEAPLLALRDELGDRFTPVVGDATDADLAGALIAEHRPGTVVLNAGAVPHMAPLTEQTWETFSRAWDTDTQAAFGWTRAALRAPLAPGSTVVSMIAGAALRGSPLSGGYAGAKATMRFIAGYAAAESERTGLGIRFAGLIAMLTPLSAVGAAGGAAYAEQDPNYLDAFKPYLTPELVGATVVELAGTGDGTGLREVLLTGAGARAVPPT